MEVLSFEAISSSQPLVFKVGPNRREFFIHSALIASLSPSLKQLVDGPWAESTTGVVEWDHIEEATFVHFCQYAYTTSYTVQQFPSVRPNPEASSELVSACVPEPEPEPEPVADTEAQDEFDIWGGLPRKTKKKKKYKVGWHDEEGERAEEASNLFPAQLQSTLQHKLEQQPQYSSETPKAVSDEQGVTACFSYSEIFLAHIRIFILADYHQINDLANKALDKLHRAFKSCQAEDRDVIEVTALYVKEDLPDRLGELVLAYIASQATRMWNEPQFKELLQQDSGMALDLLNIVMEAAKA